MKGRKASGANIPEAQRGALQVKLRLPEDVLEDLDGLAARWGLTRSGAVARMVSASRYPTPKPCAHMADFSASWLYVASVSSLRKG